jgi:hypothetical protein
MAISFQCNGCGKAYQVADHLAGETVNCTACERPMTVPASAEAKLELATAIAEQTAPATASSAIDPILLRGPTPPTPPPPGPRPMPKPFQRTIPPPPPPSLLPPSPRGILDDTPASVEEHQPTIAEAIAALPPLTQYADLDIISPPKKTRPRLLGRATGLVLSDEVARLVSWLLLIALLFCCIWGGRHIAEVVRQRNDIPEAFKSGFPVFIALQAIKSAVTFFFIFAPTLLLACALACSWTQWDLPNNAFLRACGAATLPSLFIAGWIMLVSQRALIALLIVVVATPFLLIIGLKELMGLKWPTTFVAALLLLVIVPVEAVAMVFVSTPINREIAKIAGVDEEALRQWAAEHPEELAAVRQSRGVSAPNWTRTAPAAVEQPDPLGNLLDPTIAEMREAMNKSRAQTKEEIEKVRDAFSDKIAPLNPANGAYSRSWNEANNWISQLTNAAASAPRGATPTDQFTSIEDPPLAVPVAETGAIADDSCGFKSIRVRPTKDAKIDLTAFSTRDMTQRWLVGEAGVIELSITPMLDPKQQRPWIADRRVIAELAAQRNLFAVVIEGKTDVTVGRMNGLAWTRAISRDTFGHPTEAVYAARLPQAWLVARMTIQRGYRGQDVDADRFVQGIRLTQPGDTAALDPYDPSRMVDRYAEMREDPSEVLRAAGEVGLDALLAYAARLGDSTPLRARSLLDDLASSHLNDEPRPIDVGVALATISGAGGDNTKRYALKRLAVTPAVERRDEIAAALEKVISNDAFGHVSDPAADALRVWWRPQTVENLLPLLDERVWPLSKRDAAIKVLARTHDKQAVLPIVRWIIKDPEGVVPALKEMGPIAEDEVIKLLRQPDAKVRTNAARILSDVGTEKCLIELRRAANDPRDVAAAAVARSSLESVLARVKQSKS